MKKHSALLVAAAITAGSANAGFILTNGPGNGSVNIEVDSFGSFGSGISYNSPDSPGAATHQTINGAFSEIGPASLTFVGVGPNARRVALTSGDFFGSGNLTPTTITNDNGAAVSNFTLETTNQPTLEIALRQSIESLFSGTTQSGSVLIQTYSITNSSSNNSVLLNFGRFLDATLSFDGSQFDGGGQLNLQGDSYVFLTDAADTGVGSQATTFAGLNAGFDEPTAANAYRIDRTTGVGSLPQRLAFGAPLEDFIYQDNNGDNFVDAPLATADLTDLALAFTSEYLLGPGGSTSFTSRTIFGFGAPDEVTPNPPTEPIDPPTVPAPASVFMVLIGLLGIRRLRNA